LGTEVERKKIAFLLLIILLFGSDARLLLSKNVRRKSFGWTIFRLQKEEKMTGVVTVGLATVVMIITTFAFGRIRKRWSNFYYPKAFRGYLETFQI
jgi:hypothetical protein